MVVTLPAEERATSAHLQEAARMAAESRKAVEGILGDAAHRRAVIGEGVVPEQFFFAVDEGEVVGILGVSRNQRDFVVTRRGTFLKHYGSLEGLARYIAYKIGVRLYYGPELYIAAFLVDPRTRGKGVGDRLLSQLIETAKAKNLRIYTDVKRGNDKALRFYEKRGFRRCDRFWLSAIVPRAKGATRVVLD